MTTKDEAGPELVEIITCRCADLPTPLAGSTVGRCQICEEPVWLSPATSRAASKHAVLICNACAKPLMARDHPKPEPPNDDQRLEIARVTGLYGDALDRAIARAVEKYTGGSLT